MILGNVAQQSSISPTEIILPEGTWTIAQWETGWDSVYTSNDVTATAYSESNDQWELYGLSYYIDGATSMFRATGDTTYLDIALRYTENIIDNATPSSDRYSPTPSTDPSSREQDSYNDGYLGWTAKTHPDQSVGETEQALYDSYCFRYVAVLLRAMFVNTTVYNTPSYKTKYENILAFTETNIWNKWRSRNLNNLYRTRTHMASHWALIALHLRDLSQNSTIQTDAAAFVSEFDSTGFGDGDAQLLGANLRNELKANPADANAYSWSAIWDQDTNPQNVQDVSHGNAIAAYIVEAYEYGSYWDIDDISAFSTLVESVILENQQTDSYPEFVDGTSSDNGWISDGFNKLGRYSSSLQLKIQAHTVATGMQFQGAGALNRYILGRS